jgi:hypothetical protein
VDGLVVAVGGGREELLDLVLAILDVLFVRIEKVGLQVQPLQLRQRDAEALRALVQVVGGREARFLSSIVRCALRSGL